MTSWCLLNLQLPHFKVDIFLPFVLQFSWLFVLLTSINCLPHIGIILVFVWYAVYENFEWFTHILHDAVATEPYRQDGSAILRLRNRQGAGEDKT